MRLILFFFCFSCLSISAVADFRDAASLRDAMQEKQTQRWNALPADQGLILGKQIMGNRTVTYQEPVKEKGEVVYVRQVPPVEMQQRIESAAGVDPAAKQALLQHYPAAMNKVLGALSSQTGGQDMGMLMGLDGIGSFMAAAPTPGQIAAEREAEKKKQLADLDRFFETAKIVGTEVVGGRETYHLRSDNLEGQAQFEEGVDFEPQSADVWIDKEELVQVQMKFTGKLTRDNQARDMSIELLNSNFERVGPFFEPRHQVARMGGVLSPKEQQELKKAQAELAKFKQQLDAMPPNQQAMIKQMMGSKMEQFEKMASSGGIEMETIVERAMIGGVVEYGTQMASYAAGLPPEVLMEAGLPVSQQP